MGIESDQVVYAYLSRVGDVAHQSQLPSADRMRLVSALRDEIDRRRAKAAVDSPAAVRRILDHLGTPHEVVAAAGGTGPRPDGTPGPEAGTWTAEPPRKGEGRAAAVPVQRDGAGRAARGAVPRPRTEGAAPPHLAGADELGRSRAQPDWWRVEGGPFGTGDEVPGFVGGIVIPELLRRPPHETARRPEPDGTDPDPAASGDTAAAAEAAPGEASARRLRLPAAREWNNPLLLCAAALLVAGAVLGNLLPLALGWLIAWASRRLTRAEVKGAVLVAPALAVAAGAVWLWGRGTGRWGDPIAEDGMREALAGTWPWVLRGAAVASALFLVWRSQRRR